MARISVMTWPVLAFLAGCNGCGDNPNGKDSGSVTCYDDDQDGDGYINGDCEDGTDCDDENPDVHPDAAEICNGIDDNCDFAIDDDDPSLDESTLYDWYADQDGDGFGSDSNTDAVKACDPPWENGVLDGGDCDDDDDAIYPGAIELCNEIDDDCDGLVDINVYDGVTGYADTDGDGYGDPATEAQVCSCGEGEDYVCLADDCDDTDGLINPGAAEACFNGADEDCDGEADNACPIETCGDITTDTTWEENGVGYYVSCDIEVGAKLTIDPGTQVYFAPDVGMTVGSEATGGALIIDASDDPVVFTSGVSFIYPELSSGAGDWKGLAITEFAEDRLMVLDGLELSYGGQEGDRDFQGGLTVQNIAVTVDGGRFCDNLGSGIVAIEGAQPSISGATLCDNTNYGFYADDDSGPLEFSPNSVSGNGLNQVSVLARYGGALDGSTEYPDLDTYIELRGDTVENDLSLDAQDIDYYISGSVAVYSAAAPQMEVKDGAVLRFAYDTGLQIGSSSELGDLTVDGTSGVTFTAMDESKGWDGITVQQGSDVVSLKGLTISYGGNNSYGNLYLVNGSKGMDVTIEDSSFTHSATHGLYIGASVEPLITGTEFSNNKQYGVYAYDSTSNEGGLYDLGTSASFVGNTLTGNAVPMTIPAAYLAQLDNSSSFVGNTSDLIEVSGSTVAATGTWQQQDADYLVTGDIDIQGSASPMITIEEGATFYIDDDVEITVGDSKNGGLTTEGTTSSMVTFTSAATSPGPGDWKGITLGENTSSSSNLAGLEVSYAGGNRYGGVHINGAALSLEDCALSFNDYNGLYIESDATSLGSAPAPTVERCTLEGNEASGLVVETYGGLDTFTDNILTGNGDYPAEVDANWMSALNSTSTYTGNGDDRVLVTGANVDQDSTWEDLDVDFLVESALDVGDTTNKPTLKIQGGSTVYFASGAGITIGNVSTGLLSVAGSSSAKVTFTADSSSPSAGDWLGLYLKSKCSTSTIKYLTVEYGTYGGSFDCSSSVSVSNSTFKNNDSADVYCSSARGKSTSFSSSTATVNDGCTGI